MPSVLKTPLNTIKQDENKLTVNFLHVLLFFIQAIIKE